MTEARRDTGTDMLRRAFPISRPLGDEGGPVWGKHWRRLAIRLCLSCYKDGGEWTATMIWEYTGPLEHRRVIAKPDTVWAQCVGHYLESHLDPSLEDIRGL